MSERAKKRRLSRIGTRLFIGFSLIYGVFLFASGVEFLLRRNMVESYGHQQMGAERLMSLLNEIDLLAVELQRMEEDVRGGVRRSDDPMIAKIVQSIGERFQSAGQSIEADAEAKARLARSRELFGQWSQGLIRSANWDTIRKNREAFWASFEQVLKQAAARRQSQWLGIQRLSLYTDRVMMIMALSSLILIMLLGMHITRSLQRRIEALHGVVEALEAGTYKPGSVELHGDEFDVVSMAFDRMARTLSDRQQQLDRAIAQLEEVNNHLESLVEERTRKLLAAQEELRRKERLSMLGTLAGSIGHELRNPLTVIAASAYFLANRLNNGDAKIQRHLKMITHQITASNRIISNLLDFTRDKQPQREPSDLNRLVREALDRSSIPRNVRFSLALESGSLGVHVDPEQIIQVLVNLISNAVQAMPRGGDLRIETFTKDGSRGVAVIDSGQGIRPEDAPKIFQPLFTTKQKGIGLGLAVSKKIVESNGGRIWFESTPGQGTRFFVEFVAHPSDSQRGEGAPSMEANSDGGTAISSPHCG
ncbi:MAG: HAMP domain-containing protein [Acidobacteria bacterium]|nr:MAG: HAMP domain-containing protein [Acidobacteriota bacterium]